MKPPRTRKGALGFLRGWDEMKFGLETVAQIRVSFPTFPQLAREERSTPAHLRPYGTPNVRELHTC